MKSIHLALVLGVAFVAGCGQGAGSGGGDDTSGPTLPPPPPPPTLLALNVYPATLEVVVGETPVFQVVGNFSDGSLQPVTADWNSSDESVLLLTTLSGSQISGEALDGGFATVRADYLGMHDECQVTVRIVPESPGPIYGCNQNGAVTLYPDDGSAPSAFSAGGGGRAFIINRAGTALYGTSGLSLLRTDLATAAVTTVATFPADANGWYGADSDDSNRIYCQSYGTGNVMRFDPANSTLVSIGNTGGSHIDLAVSPANLTYFTPIFTGVGGPWISVEDPANNDILPWANAPNTVGQNTNTFVVPTGICINSYGETFIGDACMSFVFRYVDVNQDGDAMDAGERVLFADLPGNGSANNLMYGITSAPGGTVLINVQSGPTAGIYWLADLNQDGDALDTDETTIFNTASIVNGFDGGCITGRR